MKDLLPLKPEEIIEKGFTPEHLWQVKYLGDIFGPFDTLSLKQYFSLHPEILNEIYLKREQEDKWMGYWDQPLISRRSTPKLHELHPQDQGQQYWILIDGQKMGPLSEAQVHQWIQDKICFSEDLISLDHGLSWSKVYLIDKFKSHFETSSHLPNSVEETQVHGEINSQGHEEEVLNQTQLFSLVLGQKASEQKIEVKDVMIPEPPKFKLPPALFASLTAVVFSFGLGVWYILTPKKIDHSVVIEQMDQVEPETETPKLKTFRHRAPASIPRTLPSGSSLHPNAQLPTQRKPASSRRSRFPEYRETHPEELRDPPVEPADFPEVDSRDSEQPEPSLVKENPPVEIDEPPSDEPQREPAQANDAAASPEANEPVVEESGDF